MSNQNPSPSVQSIEWGKMEVEGLASGKDMKLWPGGGRKWDWKETGTSHNPGIQVADVEELIDRGASVVVLSRGMKLVLKTCPETLEYLERRGIRYEIEETNEAVRIYNELARQGVAVGGLFHSTC